MKFLDLRNKILSQQIKKIDQGVFQMLQNVMCTNLQY